MLNYKTNATKYKAYMKLEGRNNEQQLLWNFNCNYLRWDLYNPPNKVLVQTALIVILK